MGQALQSYGDVVSGFAQPAYSSKLVYRIGIRLIPVLVLLFMIVPWFTSNVSRSTIQAFRHPSRQSHIKLHFLLPASSPNPDVFRAVVSSSILGYPIPTIINWVPVATEETDNPHDPKGRARQLENVFAVAQYLDSLTDVGKNDLVLLVDSLDSLFQLPPSILLSRYFAINTRAQELIRARLGPDAATNVTQSIVFNAEKECRSRGQVEIGCWAVPSSPLPRDLYGTATDLRAYDRADTLRYIRPRYLNSGFVLGPVKEARTLFARAAEIAQANKEVFGVNQGVLAQMFGEQEYVRESKLPNTGARRQPRIRKRGKMADFTAEPGRNYEFEIGLDYSGALGTTTKHAESQSAWTIFSDKAALNITIEERAVVEARIRNGLEEDIAELPRPLAGLGGAVPNEAKLKSWNDVPLYTNLWTGVTPATIHLNSIDGQDQKVIREQYWRQMWFAPYARELFEKQAKMLETSSRTWQIITQLGWKKIYGSVPNEMVRQKGYGAMTIDKDGNRDWIRWSDLCDWKAREEIFASVEKKLGG